MPNNHSLLDAPRVLKPRTVKAVLSENLRVQQIADRWASGSPKKVKSMEAAGTLLPRLKEQAELENRTISDARVGGAYNDTPDSEILAMHDVALLPGEPDIEDSDDDDAELRAALDDLGRWAARYAPGPDESLSEEAASVTYTVLVLDMFHPYDPNEEIKVSGFKTLEAAREYARRRTRDSLERFRAETANAIELRDRWFAYGEDCIVINGDYAGGKELDYFIEHPATAEERDWASLRPQRS